MKRGLHIVLLSAVLSSLLLGESNVKLENVTVSANKIEENIQDVPQKYHGDQ